MSTQFQEALHFIHEQYDQSWLKYILRFTALGNILHRQNLTPNFFFDFMQVYLNSRWITGLIDIWMWPIHPYSEARVNQFENFNTVSRIASRLKNNQLFTPENINAITLLPYFPELHCLERVILFLEERNILTQANFNTLIQPTHAILLTEEMRRRIWLLMPNHLLTQTNFERLCLAAEQENPQIALENVINLIMENARVPFNPLQSTHTASIHRTVSESAIKLMNRYTAVLNLDKTIKNIKTWVYGLDNSPTNLAAKRCIERITAPTYIHGDPSSGVSTRQLLALAYIAIHDEHGCKGDLEDRKALLLEGLYEIQRGDNIERGQGPNEGDDVPVCPGGTFNKIMEKLSGIHPDVEVSYIVHEGACFKFPKLVQTHAMTYLKSLTSPVNIEDYQAIKVVLDTLERDGDLDCIWNKIKEAVRTELWEEFKEAYSDHEEDARFKAMMDYGHQNSVPDLSSIKTQLASSLGYQAYLDAQIQASVHHASLSLSLLNHGLWTQRQASAEHQRAFDQQYGLVSRSSK